MVTPGVRSNPFSRVDAARSAQRIASPAVIIGLGSTACQISRHLEDTTSTWSATDRKSLGYLYLDMGIDARCIPFGVSINMMSTFFGLCKA